MKSARADFHIIGLHNDAALRMPVFFEGKNQFLKIHNFLLAVLAKQWPIVWRLNSCIIPILNQSAIFVGSVVGFLNVYKIRLVASSLPPRYHL
jgi:hypothetical protein